MLNDVLLFSKVEAGAITIHARPFDVIATIEDVLSVMQPIAANKVTLKNNRKPFMLCCFRWLTVLFPRPVKTGHFGCCRHSHGSA